MLLSNNENNYFKIILPKSLEKSKYKRCNVSGDCARELWNLENMKLFDIEDVIGLDVENQTNGNIDIMSIIFFAAEHQESTIESLVKLYLEGIM